MTDTLLVGDRAYSSWSLRGWLLFEKFGLPVTTRDVDLSADSVAAQLSDVPPAVTVPTLVTGDGTVIWDSLAIAEDLAERYPDAGFWPADPGARATARALTAEMHASFHALRGTCPMNLRTAYTGVTPTAGVRADLDRLDVLWAHARAISGAGPWLFGAYSIADAFFAPVAARIAGFALPVSDAAGAYVAAHLADPAFRRWRAMGCIQGETLARYAQDHATRSWPGPEPLPARAVDAGMPENASCPYSGLAVTHLAEIGGRIFGFCNAFCRDKTVFDARAWPPFVEVYDS